MQMIVLLRVQLPPAMHFALLWGQLLQQRGNAKFPSLLVPLVILEVNSYMLLLLVSSVIPSLTTVV